MAFNPFNLFKGNPRVLELMSADSPLEQLLVEESFVSEFKKTENEALQAYMNYERYAQLITYITAIDHNNADKNRAYKFPYVASEILAVNNELTYKFLLEEVVFTEEQVEEEVELQKEADSGSDRSYSSIKSNNSINSNNSNSSPARREGPFVEADKENFVLREEGDKTLSELDLREITEDDFPQVKQKRIILVKEKVMRTVKRPYEPLVFGLLRYFSSEVVHILDGYVCRVLEALVSNRMEAFLAIIDKYAASNQLKRIFAHLQSTSVQEFLLSFITRLQESQDSLGLAEQLRFIEFIQRVCEIPVAQWPREQAVLQEKAYIFSLYSSILEKINSKINAKLHPDSENSSNSKPVTPHLRELARVLRKDHLTKIIETAATVAGLEGGSYQMGKIALQYGKLAKLAVKSYSLIKGLQSNQDDQVQKLARKILEECEDCFDPIIPACFDFVFEDYLQCDQPNSFKGRNSLLAKVQFLEVLGVLSQQDIYFSRRTIIDHNCCGHLLSLLELHPNSSILHNAIINILSPFLSNQCQPLLADKFFAKTELLGFLFKAVKADYQSRFEKKQRNRKCFMAHLTALSQYIEKLQLDTPAFLQYKQSYQWQFIHECLLEDEHALRKKPLGGHEKLRNRKPLIFFSKEQCLDHYANFLSGLKLNTFDDFQNYEPGNSDSQDQKQKQHAIDLSTTAQMSLEIQGVPAVAEDDSKYFSEDFVL